MDRLRKGTARLLARVRDLTPKLLRLTVFLTVVGIGFALFSAHQARAQLGEIMMGLGADMMRYHDAERQDAPRQLMLNGRPIHLSSGTTKHDLGTVLDYYEKRCQERDGQLHEQMMELVRSEKLEVPQVEGSAVDSVLREQDDDRGFVACLDLGEEEVDVEGLLDRFEEFEKSLDLAEIGHLRYVYARQGGGTTHFVAFWTQGRFPIREMFPVEGDAPGADPDGVPRPPESRRVLSAYEKGHPQSMTMYVSPSQDAGSLERFYRGEMADEGWTVLETERHRQLEDRPPMLVWEREERMATVVFGTDEQKRGVATVLTAR